MDLKMGSGKKVSLYLSLAATLLALVSLVALLVVQITGGQVELKQGVLPLIVFIGAGTGFLKLYKNVNAK